MSFIRFVPLIFFLLLIHSCAKVPRHDLANRVSTSNTDSLVAEAMESQEFIMGKWPNEKWWEEFEDASLNKLIETALEENPTLKKAESRFKTAAQIALQNKAKLYPEIDLNGEDNWQHLSRDGLFRAFSNVYPPVINQIDIGFNFSYQFDFWRKNRNLFEAAIGKAEALLAEQKQTALILTTSIAYTYFQAQFLLAKIAILNKIADNRATIVNIIETRKSHALDDEQKRLIASSMELEVEKELLATELSLRNQTHKLKALTALGQDITLDLTLQNLEEKQSELPDNLSLQLLTRRPDLYAQTKKVEAFAKEIGAAKADFYPNINLMAILGIETLKGGLLDVVKNFSGSLAPIFSLPIFTAGRLRAQLYEKVEMFNEAVHTYNELILTAAKEVADKISGTLLLQSQIKKESKIFGEVQKRLFISYIRMKNALDFSLPFLAIENDLLQEELNLKLLQYGKRLIQIELIYALGGGYNP